MTRRLIVILTAMLLNTCIAPAWYAPVNDHDLQCVNGECDIGDVGSMGEL